MPKVYFKATVAEKYKDEIIQKPLHENSPLTSRKSLTPKGSSRRINEFYNTERANEVACRIELEIKNPERNEKRNKIENRVENLLQCLKMGYYKTKLYRLSDYSLIVLHKELSHRIHKSS